MEKIEVERINLGKKILGMEQDVQIKGRMQIEDGQIK